jgi:hypothetical protein
VEGSDPWEKLRQRDSQPLSNTLNIDQRDIPNSTLNAAVVSPVKSASLGRLLLIDLLLFAYAADSAAKSDADVQGHSVPSSEPAADAYTADESHLWFDFTREFYEVYGERAQYANRVYMRREIEEVCDFTQQVHLGMESYYSWLDGKRRNKQRPKPGLAD